MFKTTTRFLVAATFALPFTVACGQGFDALPKHQQARQSALKAADLAREMSKSQQALEASVENNDPQAAEQERERAHALEVEVRSETEYARVLLSEAVSDGECDCSDTDYLEVLTEDGDETAHVILDGCDTYVHTKDGDEEVTVRLSGSRPPLGADCGEIAHYIDSAEDVADANQVALDACEDAMGDFSSSLSFCEDPASLFEGSGLSGVELDMAIAEVESTCADLPSLFDSCLDEVGAVEDSADEELSDIPEYEDEETDEEEPFNPADMPMG